MTKDTKILRDIEYQLSLIKNQLSLAEKRALAFEHQCDTLRRSLSYQLGSLIFKSLKSPIGLLTLPKGLLKLRSEFKKRHASKNPLTFIKSLKRAKTVPFLPEEGKICYVLHNSLPYSSGGYATRAHGVASGLAHAGHKVISLTRPGFPLDIREDITKEDLNLSETIDDIEYVRIPLPRANHPHYINLSTDEIQKHFIDLRPEVIIAATNNYSGLSALSAAHKVGLPFIYEARGFWEITRASRDQEYAKSERYEKKVLYETALAKHADHVFTLTEAMREELVRRGVAYDKITLVPNSCDPERFTPRPRDAALAAELGIPADVPVIGYVGTFVDYEGLENLAEACGILKQRGIEFRLLLVGNENVSGIDNGDITLAIQKATQKAGFTDWLIMPGRVPHDKVEAYYSLINIAPFPRKPWPVCEMVSPMKPLEAMAMEKAVLVSSVRALREMVQDGETGLVFEKGDMTSMADALEKLIRDPLLRQKLGKQGRQWVEAERTWKKTAQIASGVIRRLTENMKKPAAKPARKSANAKPQWWKTVPKHFRKKCAFIDGLTHKTDADTAALREEYLRRFGEEDVSKLIPQLNWARADICANLVAAHDNVTDIGSGRGEFVNLLAMKNPRAAVTSVDLKDYKLFFDATGRMKRVYKSIFDLGEAERNDAVTCFEVIEHLPPERLEEAVNILRGLARKKLYISVPFMEPLPLYKGHHSRFDAEKLLRLFPDAKFTVVAKRDKGPKKVYAWILCEIDCEKRA